MLNSHPGLDLMPFDGNYTSYWEMWSNMPESVKADPQCPLQTLSVPSSDNPTSWYMETYAREQHLWMSDFADVLDKMMINGYPDGGVVACGGSVDGYQLFTQGCHLLPVLARLPILLRPGSAD